MNRPRARRDVSEIKPRSGVPASRLTVPLKAVPRRPLTFLERWRVRIELLRHAIMAWRIRRRIRRENRGD